jgi:hypothetical protein
VICFLFGHDTYAERAETSALTYKCRRCGHVEPVLKRTDEEREAMRVRYPLPAPAKAERA